ncbi:hypothetical protein [Paracoccus sp. J55]|uniref:hypothetical protein n=1 Tax=Paracoccus sp. J55 TaxID=935849 RepID=UPI00048D8E96|nr:hypothetical protein [Paracoccus sp. J55]
MPDWSAIQQVWPLLIAVAGVWAKLEVTMMRNREQSARNEVEINKLEAQLEAQKLVTQKQGLMLARMEESLVSIGRTLERIDRKIP